MTFSKRESDEATIALAAAVVVYAVYDFTNYSTLPQWPFMLMLVAVAWGAVASAANAVTVRLAVQ